MAPKWYPVSPSSSPLICCSLFEPITHTFPPAFPVPQETIWKDLVRTILSIQPHQLLSTRRPLATRPKVLRRGRPLPLIHVTIAGKSRWFFDLCSPGETWFLEVSNANVMEAIRKGVVRKNVGFEAMLGSCLVHGGMSGKVLLWKYFGDEEVDDESETTEEEEEASDGEEEGSKTPVDDSGPPRAPGIYLTLPGDKDYQGW